MAAAPIEIKLKTPEQVQSFFARDLESISFFVPMDTPPAPGSGLKVVLIGPHGQGLPLRARAIEQRDDGRAGVRVAFVALDDPDRQRLATWLQRALQAPSAVGAQSRATSTPIPMPKSALSAPVGEVEAARADLQARLDRYRALDGYSLLGLESSAGGSQVRDAYGALVKRYHPHHFARHGEDVRKLATQVFVEIQRAFNEAQEIVATRSHDNDAGARRKHSGPRAGRSLDEQAMSQALQLMGLSQFQAAREVLEEALDRNEDDDRLWVMRHLVDARELRARGHADSAANAYREILEIDPRHEEARMEVERADADRGGGLFRRLVKGVLD